MDIRDIDLDKIHMDDNFVLSVVQKDMVSGHHFFYIKVDKRYLGTGPFENIDEIARHYEKMEVPFIRRYAKLAFSEEEFKKLMLMPVVVKYITERHDETENTDWLIFMVNFAFVIENENKEKICLFTLNGLPFIKHDFCPSIEITDKFKSEHPDIAEKLETTKDWSFFNIDKKTLNDLVSNRK